MLTSCNWIAAVRLLLALLVTLTDAGLGFARAQAKFNAFYKVTLLGIPIGNIAWTIDIRDKQFTVEASGATSGLLRIFSSGQGNAAAAGDIIDGLPVVSNYALSIVAGKWSDEVQILFSSGKANEYLPDSPTLPNPNRVPLTDAHRMGVVDPMTALMIGVPGTGDTSVPEACERTLPVFDGHMRYDLRLNFKRLEKVETDEGYQGTVVVCSAYFAPLAGHDPDRFLIKYLEAQRDLEIWLAPLASTRLMVPYRISIMTPIGLGVLQATQFVSVPKPTRSLATTLH